MISILILVLSVYYAQAYVSFKTPFKNNHCLKMMNIDNTNIFKNVLSSTFQLSDTSISEEEVLTVTGQIADLPNPVYIVGFAAVILLGIGILQFTLGDLTKEVYILCCRSFKYLLNII